MGVRSLLSDTPVIIIPGSSQTYNKIIITDDSSTDYTILDSYSGATTSNYMIGNATVTRPLTSKLGSFNFTISNTYGRFLSKFNGGELVRFYIDDTDATTLLFAGKIDNVFYGYNDSDGFVISIKGRACPELVDRTISSTEVSVTADVSIAGIIDSFFDFLTLTFWNGASWSEATYDSALDEVTWTPSVTNFPSALINTSFQNKKGLSAISDICKLAELDCYIEYDDSGSRWLLRLFVIGEVTNEDYGVSYGGNLVSCDSMGLDNTKVVNRAIVYGKQESSNIIMLKTENNSSSQSNLWIKDKVINLPELTTMEDVQSKANEELVTGLSVSVGGRLTAVGMWGVRPGETIPASVPYCNFNGYFTIDEMVHKIGNTFITTLDLASRQNKLEDIFIEKANPDEINTTNVNLNNMTDSYTVFFDESPSIMAHSNTLEVSGQLRLDSGKVTGVAQATPITADYEVKNCELRNYSNFEVTLDTYDVTANGGQNWEVYSTATGNIHTFTNTGTKPSFRLNLNRVSSSATSPAYESVSMVYRGDNY